MMKGQAPQIFFPGTATDSRENRILSFGMVAALKWKFNAEYIDYSDFTVTSVINIIYGDFAIENIPQGTAFCYLFLMGKGLSTDAFTLRFIQCIQRRVLQD